jgi:UDP-glucose 6-dehydrogenase
MSSLSRMMRFSTVTVSFDAVGRAAKRVEAAIVEERILRFGLGAGVGFGGVCFVELK